MQLLKLYWRVMRLLTPEKGLVLLLVASSITVSLAQFVEPVFFGWIVDALTKIQPGQASSIWSAIALLALMWIAAGLFNILASAFVALRADQLSHRHRLIIMSGYFEHLLHLPQKYYQEMHTGRLLKIMLDGAAGIANIWLSSLRSHITSFASLIFLLPATLFLNWRLGLVLIILLIASGLIIAYVMKQTEQKQTTVETFHTNYAERASDTLGNVAVVQSFTRAQQEADELRDIGNSLLNAQMPVLSWWAAATVVTRAAATITVLVIFLFGIVLLQNGLASIGDIVMFISLATMYVGKVEQAVGFLNWLFMLGPKLNEFFAVLDTVPAVRNSPGARPVGRLQGQISFSGVSFSYDERQPAVHDLSFDIEPGETIAIVGETGSGKSTTTALLCRAFDPSSGSITLDGANIKDIELESLRKNISIVFQEPLLFARTIEENLLVGKPDASTAEINAAIASAQAANFVSTSEAGLQTNVGERGRHLSGGERQRVSIARAILKDPPILILDEATSALDVSTELALQQALNQIMKNRTTIIIAHRLSTIRNADRIFVMDNGQIIESGTYESLLQANGTFRRFVDAQYFIDQTGD